VRTNQAFHRFMPQRFWVLTKPCLELNLYRRTHCYKWAGGWLSPYTKSCDGGGKDGQRGQIIGPSLVLHLSAGYSCIWQG
jgi:hypothetical protein